MNSFLAFLAMNSTSNTSTDWMFLVAGLLVATLIAAVVSSPEADVDAAIGNGYAIEQATVE